MLPGRDPQSRILNHTCVEWLLAQGGDITATDKNGDTVADCADIRNHKELAAWLRSCTHKQQQQKQRQQQQHQQQQQQTMDDYTKIKLGNGAFGIAYLAVNKKTNEECALK